MHVDSIKSSWKPQNTRRRPARQSTDRRAGLYLPTPPRRAQTQVREAWQRAAGGRRSWIASSSSTKLGQVSAPTTCTGLAASTQTHWSSRSSSVDGTTSLPRLNSW